MLSPGSAKPLSYLALYLASRILTSGPLAIQQGCIYHVLLQTIIITKNTTYYYKHGHI